MSRYSELCHQISSTDYSDADLNGLRNDLVDLVEALAHELAPAAHCETCRSRATNLLGVDES
jgi:hypothetical protein